MTNVTTSDSASLGFVQVPIVGSNLYPPEAQATEVVRYDQFVLQVFLADTRDRMIQKAAIELYMEVIALYKDFTLYEEKDLIDKFGRIRYALQALQNIYGIPEQEILQANALIHAKRYMDLKYGEKS